MRAFLIFDDLHEVLFTKSDESFSNYVKKFAEEQELNGESKKEGKDGTSYKPLDPQVIVQLFAPIVTSQRIMASQFGNIYTSIKCCNDKNVVFDEYMGCTFIYISEEDIDLMKRTLGVCLNIAKHLCGPNISHLKSSQETAQLLSDLMDTWKDLIESEQSILTESIEQIPINADLASGILHILNDMAEKIRTELESNNVHILIIVEQKFLSLFSSKNAFDLLASDILFLILVCNLINNNRSKEIPEKVSRKNDYLLSHDDISIKSPLEISSETEALSKDPSVDLEPILFNNLILLGAEEPGFTSNAVYISEIIDGMQLVTIIETRNNSISTALYKSFYFLNILNNLQLHRDIDEVKPNFDNLDLFVKKLIDGMKRYKILANNSEVDNCQKRLQLKREFLKKKLNDFVKNRDSDTALLIESNFKHFQDNLSQIFEIIFLDKSLMKKWIDILIIIINSSQQRLKNYDDFFKTKVFRSIITRSSISINKYIEEFPGLVHFLYIDRQTHRLTAPKIDFHNEETNNLIRHRVWSMINQCRIHLQEGHMLVMWKDTTFSYSYFLWFEDSSGTPLKCKTRPHLMKNLPIPGIMCGDYYRKFLQLHFPKISSNKIKISELLCIHLGLATSQVILEHTRRIAATIWEIAGLQNNPVDLL